MLAVEIMSIDENQTECLYCTSLKFDKITMELAVFVACWFKLKLKYSTKKYYK